MINLIFVVCVGCFGKIYGPILLCDLILRLWCWYMWASTECNYVESNSLMCVSPAGFIQHGNVIGINLC